LCFPSLQIGPVRIWLSKVEPLLVAFDSQLKIFHTSLDDDASCEHPKRDVKGETNDPPLGVYIKSRFSINSETVELLTFTPPVRDFPKSVLVIVYWLICSIFAARGTSLEILEVVVDEVCKWNDTITSVIWYQRERL
nr:hypothetical protein [Tanacetum cinerariifolium]